MAPEQVTTAKLITLLHLPPSTKDQERGSPTLSNDQDKMVDEPLEVSGGSCSKGTWRQFFEATGDILSLFKVFGSSKIFCKTFSRQFFLLRDLGAAYHRHCCHHGLCTPCRHLLQHGCLIIFFSYIYENEAHCTIHVIS